MNQFRNAKWMRDRGHNVVVLGISNSPLNVACNEYCIPFEPIGRHKKHYDFKAAFQLLATIKRLQIRHLIIRDGWDMGVCTMAKVLGRHSFKLHYFMEMQLGVSKKNIAQTMRFRQIDTWVCPLDWLVEEVKERTHFNPGKILKIPVGIERRIFNTSISKAQAPHSLNLPENGIILGLPGRIDIQKGQMVLLQAQKIMLEKGIPVYVALLGSPTLNEQTGYSDSISRFIEQENLDDRVFRMPFRKDHHLFYKAVDAIVMASKAETCGMVTLESMISGTPVIGSNAGGTPELLLQGNAGYLFESMNPSALAEQILNFLENPRKYDPQLLEWATEAFDHEKVCISVENHLLG